MVLATGLTWLGPPAPNLFSHVLIPAAALAQRDSHPHKTELRLAGYFAIPCVANTQPKEADYMTKQKILVQQAAKGVYLCSTKVG